MNAMGQVLQQYWNTKAKAALLIYYVLFKDNMNEGDEQISHFILSQKVESFLKNLLYQAKIDPRSFFLCGMLCRMQASHNGEFKNCFKFCQHSSCGGRGVSGTGQ